MIDIKKIDCIIAIDPGSNGGIVVFKHNEICYNLKMPKDLRDLRPFFQHLKDTCKYPIVLLERQTIRPDDLQFGKAIRIQRFLNSYQTLQNFMDEYQMPYVLIHPSVWQRRLHLVIKDKETDTQRKNRYKEAAQGFYPLVNATLWNADALLILHCGRVLLANEKDYINRNIIEPKNNFGIM